MSTIKSVLKEVIKAFPEGQTIKGAAVEPMLMKKGVKSEEIKFAELGIDPKVRYTKEDLTKLEAGRKDTVKTVEQPINEYDWVSLHDPAVESKYKEKVTTFKGGYVSEHYPAQEGYVMHTRVFDDMLDDKPTRVVQEIQSDLHQGAKDIPDAPFKKTWLKKGIERELVDALNEGRQQLAIPIKGKVGVLNRSEGAQKWYESQVVNTAKKVAKSIGADFKLVTHSAKQSLLSPPELAGVSQALANGHNIDPDVLSKVLSTPEARVAYFKKNNGSITDQDFLQVLANVSKATDATYAVITPKAGAKVGFNLYSTPVAGAFAAYTALSSGYSKDEVAAKMKEQGNDDEDINEAFKQAEKIKQAKALGYSDDEIKSFLVGQQPTAVEQRTVDDVSVEEALDILSTRAGKGLNWFSTWTEKYDVPLSMIQAEQEKSDYTPEQAKAAVLTSLMRKVEAYKSITDLTQDVELGEFVANLQVIAPNMESITTRTSGYFGNSDDAKSAALAELASRERIIKLAKEQGVTLEWYDPRGEDAAANLGLVWEPGTWLAVREDGTKVVADPGFWDSLESESGEIKGAIAGGIIGAKAGAQYTPGPPWAKFLGGAAGSMIGAAGGSAIGSQFDYMSSAVQLNQKMHADVALHRALTATEASVIGDVVAYPVVKVLGATWKQTGGRLIKQIRGGDFLGANRALKETMYLSDDEADAIVQQLERVAKTEGTQGDKEIAAFVRTEPGGEEIMKVAGTLDTTAQRVMALDIDKRAKDVLKMADSLTVDNMDKLLKNDLDNYIADVKGFYRTVKAEAAASPNMNKWTFDYAKLAIEPVLEKMEKQIVDVPALERFLRKADVIRSRADGRTFADLLDLREMVNSFRFGSGTKKATELKTYKELINKIDGAIEQGSKVVLEQPKQWTEKYALARMNYAKMKDLEKNVLFKALNAKGLNHATAVKKLVRYITSGDETWTDVMAKLPQNARYKAEGAVIDALANKFTKGDGLQAVNFPQLAEQLDAVTFTSPEARKLKGAISTLADVFKNDVALSAHSGGIAMPQAAQALTTDLKAKAHYTLVGRIWTNMQQLIPGKTGRKAALLNKAAKLLENPLNVKSAKELMDEAGQALNIGEEVLNLQRAAANEAARSGPSPLVQLFGEGKTLSFKGSGTASKKIHMTRIATAEDVIRVAEAAGINRSDKKALEHALKLKGYQAIVLGSEKVKLL